MTRWIDLHALWQILVVGLICGAGLPAVFAFGLRAWSMPAKAEPVAADGDRLIGGSPIGIAVAVVCFALAVGGIAWGMYFIVSGG